MHHQGEAICKDVRARLKERGLLGKEEHQVKKMKIKTTLLTLLTVSLIGCASHNTTPTYSLISEYYHPVVGASGNTHKTEPQYIHASSAAEAMVIYKQYLNAGYHLVGFSAFTHVYVPMDLDGPRQSDIMDQARLVHADIVLYFTVPQGHVVMNVPIASSVSPGTLSETTINAQNGEFGMPYQIGSATTWTPGQIHWQYGPRSVPRAANYVEFLAK